LKELKIEKAEDGYIVTMMDYSGKKRVFKSFGKFVSFLRVYFEGEKKVGKEEVLPDQFSMEKKREP
jgi:hypothetical protein